MIPPNERPTAQELASGSSQPMQIAGKPADVCPYCGCAMFTHKVVKMQTRIMRYADCRNEKCGRRFLTRQPIAEIVREVGEDSEYGIHQLTVLDESA